MTETPTERAARALYIHEQAHRYKTHTVEDAAAMWDEPAVKNWRDLRIASMAAAIAEYEAAKAEGSAARRERAIKEAEDAIWRIHDDCSGAPELAEAAISAYERVMAEADAAQPRKEGA